MSRPIRRAAAPLAALLAACGGGDAAAPAATVTDSAGIAIVTHAAAAIDRLPVWTVADAPVVDLGGADTGMTAFTRVAGGQFEADGGFAVYDFEARQLRRFAPDGAPRGAYGRQGGGPGEFQMATLVPARLAGDSVVLFDAMSRRVTVYDPASGTARERDVRAIPFLGLAATIGVLPDGRLLGVGFTFDTTTRSPGARYRTPSTVVALDADSVRIDTLLAYEGLEVYASSMSFNNRTNAVPMRLAFGRTPEVARAGNGFAVASADRPEVAWHDASGKVVRLSRLARPRLPVSEEAREAWIARDLEQITRSPFPIPEEIKRQLEERTRSQPFADSIPWFGTALADAAGRLWVRESPVSDDEAPSFYVFGPDGVLVARARLPERVQLMDVRGSRVLGLWKDADDVEHVRVYALPAGD